MPNEHQRPRALSDTQIQQFIRDGFVRIDRAFPRELADQGRAINGLTPLNSATVSTQMALYSLALTPDYNDITSGFNGAYSATPGYDLVTGIGAPKGWALANAL